MEPGSRDRVGAAVAQKGARAQTPRAVQIYRTDRVLSTRAPGG